MTTIYIFNGKHKLQVKDIIAKKRKIVITDVRKKTVAKKKEHPVEKNPLVKFQYPSKSKDYGYGYREVRLISANGKYLVGLDINDNNRFKKFRRDRIMRGIDLLEFNPKALV